MDNEFWRRLCEQASDLDLAKILISVAAGVAGLVAIALVGYTAKISFGLSRKAALACLASRKKAKEPTVLYASVNEALDTKHCRKISATALGCGTVTVTGIENTGGVYREGVQVAVDQEDVTGLLKPYERKTLAQKLAGRLADIRAAEDKAKLDLYAERARQEGVAPTKNVVPVPKPKS